MLPRIISGISFAALFIFALFTPHPAGTHIIFVLSIAVAWLGTHEYYAMARKKAVRPSPWPAHLISLAFLTDAYFFEFHHFVHLFITCFWALLFTQVFFKKYDLSISNVAVSLFGSIYVGLPLATLLFILVSPQKWGFQHAQAGGYLILFLMLTSWATDIGGYAFGKPFGKHKMTPVLSPKKSWEGMIGGIALAMASGALLKTFMPTINDMFTWNEAILLPAAFSILGTIGDLAESAFKRDAGIKDSGKTYTGHGGMLDIIDSLLVCAPVFFLYLEITRG